MKFINNFKILTLVSVLFMLFFLAACGDSGSTGTSPAVEVSVDIDGDGVADGVLIDTDGDGLYDGMDANNDGVVDYTMDELAAKGARIDIDEDGSFDGEADGKIVDIDGDGTADGVDTDGDGDSDISLKNLVTVVSGGTISDADAVADDAEDCAITFGGSDTADSVTTELILPLRGANGTVISWEAGNTGIISISGSTAAVTRSSSDITVTLTATISKGTAGKTRTFSITVKSPVPNDYIMRYHLDSNGNDETGTLNLSNSTGAPAYGTTSPPEGSGYLVVDGDDSIYSTANYTKTGTAYSISAWVYLDSASSENYMTPVQLSFYNYGSDYSATGLAYYVDDTEMDLMWDAEYTGSTDFSTGDWYHVAGTVDDSYNMILYINGLSKSTNTFSEGSPLTAGPVYIGCDYFDDTFQYYWNGYIDDVIIYDRELSSDEISDIYNSY